MIRNENFNRPPKNKIDAWIRNVFQLSENDRCEVDQVVDRDDPSSFQTQITIDRKKNGKKIYTVGKPVSDVTRKDVQKLRFLEAGMSGRSLWGFVLRFFAWWFAFAGIYSMAGVCPCCGQVGCPVGASGAGVLGGVGALCMQNWKQFMVYLKIKKG